MLGLHMPTNHWSLQDYALDIKTPTGSALENQYLGVTGLWIFVILDCLFQFPNHKLDSIISSLFIGHHDNKHDADLCGTLTCHWSVCEETYYFIVCAALSSAQ